MTPSSGLRRLPPPVLLLALIYLGFVSLGLPDGTLGVAWPPMQRQLDLPLAMAGWLVALSTLLSAASSYLSPRLLARWGTGPVVAASGALTGGAIWIFATASGPWWLVLGAIPLGLGAGAVDVGLNSYVARHYSGRHMSWLHACWGVGATLGPLVLTQSLGWASGWRGGYQVIGTAQLALALIFVLSLALWARVPERTPDANADEGGPARMIDPSSPNGRRAVGLSVLVFVLYVAVETTAGLWANSVLVLGRNVDPATAGRFVSAYYASITIGRLVLGGVVDRWGNRRMVTGGAVVALGAAVLFALAPTPALAGVALVLLGLAFAPIYPGMMHETPRRFGHAEATTIMGRQSSAAYFGAAFMPALGGAIATRGSLEGIAWLLVAGVAALLVTIRAVDALTPVPPRPARAA